MSRPPATGRMGRCWISLCLFLFLDVDFVRLRGRKRVREYKQTVVWTRGFVYQFAKGRYVDVSYSLHGAWGSCEVVASRSIGLVLSTTSAFGQDAVMGCKVCYTIFDEMICFGWVVLFSELWTGFTPFTSTVFNMTHRFSLTLKHAIPQDLIECCLILRELLIGSTSSEARHAKHQCIDVKSRLQYPLWEKLGQWKI